MAEITRRDFIKLGAVGTGTVAAVTSLGFDVARAVEIKQGLRIAGAKEVHSVCPYCAVGCSLIAFTKQSDDGRPQLFHIDGDPDSPINEGRLCPKGATAMQIAVSSRRAEKPLYRAPGSEQWQEVDWNTLLDRLAQRIKESRDATFVTHDGQGNVVNRCEGIAFAGGAAFSSEEGYFAAKLMRGLGLVHLEQQARV